MSFAWSKAAETKQVDEAVIDRLRADLLSVKHPKRRVFNESALADVEHVAKLPFREGLFEFARRIKARGMEHGVSPTNNAVDPLLQLLLERWGRPYTVDAIRTEFRHFIDHCKRPAGQGVIEEAAALCSAPESWPAEYEAPETNHLLALCKRLAEASADGVFFLSCRRAADICGFMTAMTAGSHLNKLLKDGWIEVVEAHTKIRARRFRLTGKKPTLQRYRDIEYWISS